MATSNLRRNGDYWARRMKNMEDALLDQSYAYVENLDEQFRAAEAEIERQLSAWYQRFADNNEISLAEARKLLNSNELAEFRWTVEEYIKHGEENALTGAWMKELENASARVHISRLDALKIQLQQQAELLYSNQLDALDAAARQTYTGSFYHTAYEIQRGLGVGWTMQAINESAIQKVLSRPWTTDGQTFRDRCWTNKQSLVNSVNTQLTQMIVRGESADRAISAISKQFEVSRSKAGRLVMTESAYFSSAAQKDCFTSLGVERYVLVASFDHDTCELCGALDGKVFKMSEYRWGHGSAVSSLVPVLHGPILRGHGGHRRTLGAERGRHHRQGPGRNHLRGMEEWAYKIGGCSAERTWYNGLSRTGGRGEKRGSYWPGYRHHRGKPEFLFRPGLPGELPKVCADLRAPAEGLQCHSKTEAPVWQSDLLGLGVLRGCRWAAHQLHLQFDGGRCEAGAGGGPRRSPLRHLHQVERPAADRPRIYRGEVWRSGPLPGPAERQHGCLRLFCQGL